MTVLRTARHPPEVRAALRATCMRPLMKQCFRNSQMLLLGAHELALTYVEGWAARSDMLFWFEHGWLIWHRAGGDQILDVTLEPSSKFGPIIYGPAIEIPRHDVEESIATHRSYICIRERELSAIRPK